MVIVVAAGRRGSWQATVPLNWVRTGPVAPETFRPTCPNNPGWERIVMGIEIELAILAF